MTKLLAKYKRQIFITALLVLGFLVRIYFVDKFVYTSGDLLLYGEWGEKFWEYGSKNFYFAKDWYYAPPNYPPIISLMYAAAFWLFDHRYILAEIHNATRLIPSNFIIYFGKIDPLNPFRHGAGYYLLVKLPAILADLGLGLFIYRILVNSTKSWKKGVIGLGIYIFNPVTILLSAVWGQTESVIALLGLGAFVALFNKRIVLSCVLYFLSLYIKPNWIYLSPLYGYLLFQNKPKAKDLILGTVSVLTIFYLTSAPFARTSVVDFALWLIRDRLWATAVISYKLSISAFSSYTIFAIIDKTPNSIGVLGLQLKHLGWIAFLATTAISIYAYKISKKTLVDLMAALFIAAFGAFLFLTSMLERYFFPAFVPLIILAITRPKILMYAALINLSTCANLVHGLFRRRYGVIADLFSASNFLLIRTFSALNLVGWLYIAKNSLAAKNPVKND